ncbi:hypothetical protein GN958_ATG20274 [Phytophthora infestans]|uniref:Uncharacterized protein n=1 Tax=Phytophthora infestans TaxID=4787 RepID=A0A8S9TU64_PHYIN|nr:hypothetical protein GN958_ATG20274 [Phytophthora infestans]
MVVVISHNVSLTGGAIQPSGQVADLDRLISQQESQVLRPRGRTVLPPWISIAWSWIWARKV